MDPIMFYIADAISSGEGPEVEFLEDDTIEFIVDDYIYQIKMHTKDIYP